MSNYLLWKSYPQKYILSDLVFGLKNRWGWLGWRFSSERIPHAGYILRGDNKNKDLHFVFVPPLKQLQELGKDRPRAIEHIHRQIKEMIQFPSSGVKKNG